MIKLIQQLVGLNTVLLGKVRSIQAYDEAMALRSSGDFKKAIPLLQESSELGNERAMCFLGVSYLNGQGIAENGKLAEKWLVASVEAGYEPAESVLGMAYVTGKAGHTIKIDKGRALLEKAAAGGDEQSARMLEMMDKRVGLFKNLKRK